MAEEAGTQPLELVEEQLLGEHARLTELEVAERSGVPVEVARQLWHLLGFAAVEEDERAFTEMDVRALRLTRDLIELGVLSEDRQEGLVRTWGRSFARLAEWQIALLADIAAEAEADPTEGLLALADDVLPRVEQLQSYVWRRHLMSVGSRLLASDLAGSSTVLQGVCFVDIVGYTSRSRTLSDRELVSWLERFEGVALDTVVEHGGRIIKNIGDELLIVADTAQAAADIALELTRRGDDPDDDFPAVRAGVAFGEVVLRLGDVFGPVVNIASRLTSAARPGRVLVDRGAYEALTGRTHDDDDEADRPEDRPDPDRTAKDDRPGDDATPYRLKRVRRISVKGYSRLKAWAIVPAERAG